MFSRILFSALAAVCFFYACPAQDLHYINYSVNEGLPSSQVHDIYQDQRGRLWFATDRGISCYDGYDFKNYTTADGLTDDVVFKFHPTRDGKIWCTTFNRTVFSFHGKDPVFTPYQYNHILKQVPDCYVANNLFVGDDGSLFMGLVNGIGYIHIDKKGKVVNNDIGGTSDFIDFCMMSGENGSSFFYNQKKRETQTAVTPFVKITRSGISDLKTRLSRAFYFPAVQTTVFADINSIEIVPGKGKSLVLPCTYQPISLGMFTPNTFWVGFRYGGLAVYDMQGKCLFTTLKGKSVTRFLTDHEGGYWCSTLHDGVYHAFNTNVFSYVHTYDEKNWINCFSRDSKNTLWIGYYHGNVSRMQHGKIIKVHKARQNLPALVKRSEETGEMIYMSDECIVFPERQNKIIATGFTPQNICVLSADSIVMSGYVGPLTVYKGKISAIRLKVRANDVVHYREKWYVATSIGLIFFESDTISNKVLDKEKIVDLDTWNDCVLMATKGSGVLIWDGDKTFEINTTHGLTSNIITGVYPQNDSVIWAYNNAGLSRVVLQNKKVTGIRHFSMADGLISNEVTAVEVIHDTVWIGTRHGLCFFPTSVLQEKKSKPVTNYLDIAVLKVNDKPKHFTGTVLELDYSENRVEFLFGAVSFSGSQKPLYRYKLNGIETGWKYTRERMALYASLPAGKYMFEVQVKTAGTGWSKTTSLNFIISPPFWKTWWFMVAGVLVLCVLVYLFFRFRILSYNRDITRELLRQLLKRLKRKTNHVVFREQGKDIRIPTETICFIKADGNYIEIHTDSKKYVIRHKIGEFLDIVPDPLEYLRVNRSYIVRLDKVQEKSKKELIVKGETITVGETYVDQLQKIKF